MAVLRIADGSRETLRSGIELAGTDWRDAISNAEYREHSRRVRGLANVSERERAEILEVDRLQYEAWVGRRQAGVSPSRTVVRAASPEGTEAPARTRSR